MNARSKESGAISTLAILLIVPLALMCFCLFELLQSHSQLILTQESCDQLLIKTLYKTRQSLTALIDSNLRLKWSRDLAGASALVPETAALLQAEIHHEFVLQEALLLELRLNSALTLNFDFTREPEDPLGPGILTIQMKESQAAGDAPFLEIQVEVQIPPTVASGVLVYGPISEFSSPLLEAAPWKAHWSPPQRTERTFPWFYKGRES